MGVRVVAAGERCQRSVAGPGADALASTADMIAPASTPPKQRTGAGAAQSEGNETEAVHGRQAARVDGVPPTGVTHPPGQTSRASAPTAPCHVPAGRGMESRARQHRTSTVHALIPGSARAEWVRVSSLALHLHASMRMRAGCGIQIDRQNLLLEKSQAPSSARQPLEALEVAVASAAGPAPLPPPRSLGRTVDAPRPAPLMVAASSPGASRLGCQRGGRAPDLGRAALDPGCESLVWHPPRGRGAGNAQP